MDNETAIYNGLSGLLRTHVLAPICSYLQTRQQQGSVTVEELSNVLKLPAATPATSPSVGTNLGSMAAGFPPTVSLPGLSTPPALTGFAGMPIPASSQKRKTSKQPISDNDRCIYIFARGKKEGTRCASKKEAGIQYCNQHKGRRVAQTAMQGGAPQTGQAVSNFPSMPGLPGLSSVTPTMPQQPKIQVHPVSPGLYREAVHGLAIKTGSSPNEYIACGVLTDPKSTTITPLTPDKIEYCRQINLAYVDPTRPDAAVVKPTMPSANVSGQTVPPMAQQMPTIPSGIPSSLPGMPQVQGIGGIPSTGFGTAVTDIRDPDDPDDGDDDEEDDDDDS